MNEWMNEWWVSSALWYAGWWERIVFHQFEIIDSDYGWKAACRRLVVDVMGGSRMGSGAAATSCPTSAPVVTSLILWCAKYFSQIRGLHGPLPWHLLSLSPPLGLDLRNYWKFRFLILTWLLCDYVRMCVCACVCLSVLSLLITSTRYHVYIALMRFSKS